MLTPQSEKTPVTRESLATLASGILSDARKLVQLELQLAVAVLREEAKELGKSSAYLGAGLALMLVAALLGGLALSEGLRVLSDLPAWSCQLIVTAIFALGSLFAFRKARQ